MIPKNFVLAALPLMFAIVAVHTGCNQQPVSDSTSGNKTTSPATSSSERVDEPNTAKTPSDIKDKPSSSQQQAAQQETSTASAKTDERSVQQVIREIAKQAEQGRFDQALRLAQNALLKSPEDPQLLLMNARLLAETNQLDLAVQVADSIQSDAPEITVAKLGQTSEWLIAQGKLSEAEKRLKKLLELIPGNPIACQLLFRIYNAQGRRFESVPFIRQYIQAGSFQLSDLAMLCNIENTFLEDDLFSLMSKVASEKDHALVYDARRSLINQNLTFASDRLAEARSINPANLEAWVWYGYVQASIENWSAMEDWFSSRPKGFGDHPQFWIVLGMWYEQLNRKQEAIRAYVNTLKIDPRSPTATSRIGNCLIDLGNIELAEDFRERTYLLTKSNSNVRDLLANLTSGDDCMRISKEYQLLGDEFLAEAWAKVAIYFAKNPPKPLPNQPASPIQQSSTNSESQLQEVQRLKPAQLAPLIERLMALNLPEIQIENIANATSTDMPLVEGRSTQLAFKDVAQERGLASAEFDWGRLPSEKSVMNYRALGGGVAVLDYDNDGYPDLFFSRAGAKISEPEKNKPKQFFRNLSGNFIELSPRAFGFEDRGYGQGLACGDFNQDGFTDLLVANIGSLKLYCNNGDGTFNLVYSDPLQKQNRWVAACTIADVNRDGLPDITAATYLGDSNYETRECTRDGVMTYGCPPQQFPGCKDFILANLGTGRWEYAEDSLMQGDIDLGRGLGVVVGDIDQQIGNEIYISNDTTGNHYFINQVVNNEVKLFQNSGAAGVAVDSNGRPQGSMGIAVCDLDRNGLDDIFVTNAVGEYNALYLQKKPNLFVDASRTWNFYQSSLRMVGFGCVFSDIDCDGWKDALVLNGHLDDYSDIGEGFKLLPQLYHNDGKRMNLVSPEALKGYFTQPTLGRGLATVDFDVDHRHDFVATHCDQHASLIQNITHNQNHFIEFILVGRQCDRDAIGARVKVKCADETWTDGLYAGESYYSSCEKILQFGLGQKNVIDEVLVQWPDGSQQSIKNPVVDQRYLVIQDLDFVAQ